MTTQSFDIAVIGGGPTGLVAALGLADAGYTVAIIDPMANALPPRGRTTAILGPQIDVLRELGLWQSVAAASAPLCALRIVNRVDGLADEEVIFGAEELGSECFGSNVVNADLVHAARARVAGHDGLTVLATALTDLRRQGGTWRLECAEGFKVRAGLLIAADGKRSMVRERLRMGARVHRYGQIANTAQLTHLADHEDISTEVHKAGGPFTTVPLGERRSSLVWLENEDDAKAITVLDDDAFAAAAGDAAPWLGRITGASSRSSLEIVGLLAHRFAGPGVLLVGESAHAVSPLGAQGFNLSLRDCATLAQLARSASSLKHLASPDGLRDYERARYQETSTMFWLIDAMNRAVQIGSPTLGRVRGLGLKTASRIAPVRQQLMRRLMAPRPAAVAAAMAV